MLAIILHRHKACRNGGGGNSRAMRTALGPDAQSIGPSLPARRSAGGHKHEGQSKPKRKVALMSGPAGFTDGRRTNEDQKPIRPRMQFTNPRRAREQFATTRESPTYSGWALQPSTILCLGRVDLSRVCGVSVDTQNPETNVEPDMPGVGY